MKQNERIKDIIIAVLLIVIFIYFILGINSLSHGDKMGFFNLRCYIMSSDSDESNANAGDLIVATKIKTENIKENDSIIYKKNNRLYIEEAKENNLQDKEVVGKFLFKVKGLGNIAMFMRTPLGIINILMIFVCAIIIIKKIVKNREESSQDDLKTIESDNQNKNEN
jgi:hypothetical protein